MNKILELLNIRPDKNQRWILGSLFISGLLATYISPAITKAIITELPAEWIAFESLFSSVVGLVIGIIWKGGFRQGIIRWFIYFCIGECLAGCLLGLYLCFIHYNVWVFAITTLIYSNFIATLVSKCIMAFKSVLWIEKEREIYDNNLSIVSGIVCMIGFGLALLVMPSLKVALFIWALGCIFDDIGWIIVYIQNKEKLKRVD